MFRDIPIGATLRPTQEINSIDLSRIINAAHPPENKFGREQPFLLFVIDINDKETELLIKCVNGSKLIVDDGMTIEKWPMVTKFINNQLQAKEIPIIASWGLWLRRGSFFYKLINTNGLGFAGGKSPLWCDLFTYHFYSNGESDDKLKQLLTINDIDVLGVKGLSEDINNIKKFIIKQYSSITASASLTNELSLSVDTQIINELFDVGVMASEMSSTFYNHFKSYISESMLPVITNSDKKLEYRLYNYENDTNQLGLEGSKHLVRPSHHSTTTFSFNISEIPIAHPIKELPLNVVLSFVSVNKQFLSSMYAPPGQIGPSISASSSSSSSSLLSLSVSSLSSTSSSSSSLLSPSTFEVQIPSSTSSSSNTSSSPSTSSSSSESSTSSSSTTHIAM